MHPGKAQQYSDRLLVAIASVESGRWNRETGVNIAWPWTVTAEGAGKFHPSRRAAIAAVSTLQRRGIRNIDVGYMQINLGYHPEAFRSLNHAFDPSTNAAYAAKFLKELRIQRRSWDKAMRYYHSSDPKRQRYYGDKVYKARHAIRLRDANERRNTRVALAKTRQANQPSVQNQMWKRSSAVYPCPLGHPAAIARSANSKTERATGHSTRGANRTDVQVGPTYYVRRVCPWLEGPLI